MGNQISHELVSSSLGVHFISRVLDQASRCQASPARPASVARSLHGGMTAGAQMARSSAGLWVAVESARDGGACIARRLVRVRMDHWDSKMWHAEERDGLSGEWRAIAEPTFGASREYYSCAVGSLLYVLGGLDASFK